MTVSTRVHRAGYNQYRHISAGANHQIVHKRMSRTQHSSSRISFCVHVYCKPFAVFKSCVDIFLKLQIFLIHPKDLISLLWRWLTWTVQMSTTPLSTGLVAALRLEFDKLLYIHLALHLFLYITQGAVLVVRRGLVVVFYSSTRYSNNL